ncbi:MAG: SH3 domain-containing protein [Dehalococcoidia bacterium]
MARTLAFLLLVFAALAVVAACNDDSDFLLEEDSPEATGTPPFFERSPLPSPAPSPEGSPPAAGATPVTPFKIEVEDTVNRRTEPSLEGTVQGTLDTGDTATVIASIPGEAVTPDNDTWYQLDDGSFVYSGAVKKVEE